MPTPTPSRPPRPLPNIPGTDSPFPFRPAAPQPPTTGAPGPGPGRPAVEDPPLSPTFMNPRPAPQPPTPGFERTPGDGFEIDAFQRTPGEQLTVGLRKIASAAGLKAPGTSSVQQNQPSNEVSATRRTVLKNPKKLLSFRT